jgi:hypothetical protein
MTIIEKDWKGLKRTEKDWKGLKRTEKDWKGLKGLKRPEKDWKELKMDTKFTIMSMKEIGQNMSFWKLKNIFLLSWPVCLAARGELYMKAISKLRIPAWIMRGLVDDKFWLTSLLWKGFFVMMMHVGFQIPSWFVHCGSFIFWLLEARRWSAVAGGGCTARVGALPMYYSASASFSYCGRR